MWIKNNFNYGLLICLITFIGYIIIPIVEITRTNEFNIFSLYQDILLQLQNEEILKNQGQLLLVFYQFQKYFIW